MYTLFQIPSTLNLMVGTIFFCFTVVTGISSIFILLENKNKRIRVDITIVNNQLSISLYEPQEKVFNKNINTVGLEKEFVD